MLRPNCTIVVTMISNDSGSCLIDIMAKCSCITNSETVCLGLRVPVTVTVIARTSGGTGGTADNSDPRGRANLARLGGSRTGQIYSRRGRGGRAPARAAQSPATKKGKRGGTPPRPRPLRRRGERGAPARGGDTVEAPPRTGPRAPVLFLTESGQVLPGVRAKPASDRAPSLRAFISRAGPPARPRLRPSASRASCNRSPLRARLGTRHRYASLAGAVGKTPPAKEARPPWRPLLSEPSVLR
jgi:hypothetical protein